MRVCFISVSDQLGGSEVALLEMIRALERVRSSWTFHVILPGAGPLRERLLQAGASCTIVPLPAGLARVGESSAVRDQWSVTARVMLGLRLGAAGAALPAYVRQLRDAVDAIDPDILHTNGLKAHVLGARLDKAGRALVWHLHEYVSPRRLTRALLRRHASRCRAIVANSASVARDVASILGHAPPPIVVVHNAVDLDVFAPSGPTLDLDALAGLDPAPGVLRVGLVGTFGRWKGHQVFVEALARVFSATAHPLRGYIVGGALYDTAGSQYSRQELEALVTAAGLKSRVGLTGFADAAAAMRSLDIIVHASTEPEPFGLVIAEGMASGRAVITTAQGGAAEVIEPGQDALVARSGDPEALASAILRLADDSDLRGRISARAREAALERFAPERMAQQLVTLYERLAQARSLPVVPA